MKRAGTADLPLHGGNVPMWLAGRMAELGKAIINAIVWEYGPSEVLTRISDPFWFQALGSVMGMDWHSSGITTSVMGALKKSLNPISKELGLYICGGRGKHSLKTPQELLELSDRLGLDGDKLVHASKLSAKVDNTCVQDGFSLYHHNFIVTDTGEWAVVQQGMNTQTKMARRYHWHSPAVRSFVSDPQSAIVGHNQGKIINLSDSRADASRNSIVEFLSRHPDRQLAELRHLTMDKSHFVKPVNVNSKRLGAVLALAYEHQFTKFTDALMLKGIGPRTLQSLALVSEVIFGAPNRFNDPARFAFAHGGKDGSPFPVPLKVYDESINILKTAVNKAKISGTDKINGLKKLSRLAYSIEKQYNRTADVNAVIQNERAVSHMYDGRTVKGSLHRRDNSDTGPVQLSLFQ